MQVWIGTEHRSPHQVSRLCNERPRNLRVEAMQAISPIPLHLPDSFSFRHFASVESDPGSDGSNGLAGALGPIQSATCKTTKGDAIGDARLRCVRVLDRMAECASDAGVGIFCVSCHGVVVTGYRRCLSSCKVSREHAAAARCEDVDILDVSASERLSSDLISLDNPSLDRSWLALADALPPKTMKRVRNDLLCQVKTSLLRPKRVQAC